MRVKAALQDANALRKVIDSVSEKGQVCIEKKLGSGRNTAQEIGAAKERYETLLKNLIVSVSNLEDAIDKNEEWQAGCRQLKDFHRNMREQFNFCDGISFLSNSFSYGQLYLRV